MPSTERLSLVQNIPADWLDRLLKAHCGIEPSASLEEAAGHLLNVAHDLIEEAAFGICIPNSDGEVARSADLPPKPPEHNGESSKPADLRLESLRINGKQLIVRSSPRMSHNSNSDPIRLFSEFQVERAIPIPGDHSSTLHVACNDEERFADNGAAYLFAHRLAHVFGSVLRSRRSAEQVRTEELRVLQEQVIQSEKLASLGQIAAGIVHELNNPLTSILAYSDFLRKKAERSGGDRADVERLMRINEAAERILRFSRDLTEYSRPSQEVPEPVAIHDVIDRALVFCEYELGKTGVMVKRDFGEVRLVQGVAVQLTQVFVNLFTNAAHAMREEGGLLSISTTMAHNGEVEVIITDDGHGVAPDALPKIFEPFFTTKTDGTGTGLGLSIVRSIVARHSGRVRAVSNTPRGMMFYVELPTVSVSVPATTPVLPCP